MRAARCLLLVIVAACGGDAPVSQPVSPSVAPSMSSEACAAIATIPTVLRPESTPCGPANFPRDELERRVASGDGCAAEWLSRALIEAHGGPDDDDRAIALTTAAFDGGTYVSCLPFEMAHDRERLVACYMRNGDEARAMLLQKASPSSK